MSKIAQALQSVVVITPAIRIWSGRVTVKRHEDLTTASGLPPEALVSDGAKRVIDPKHLTKLESQRRCVDRYLARVGIRSAMGFLIQPEMEAEVHEELQKRQIAYNESKADLVSNYDRLCREWEQAIPGFETLLRRNRPSAIEVAASCEFDYATFRITEAESDEGKRRFESVGKAATSALVADVTQSAARLLKESFKGRSTVTQRAVNVVRELVAKLRSFSVFDPRLGPAAEALEKVLEGVRSKGPLDPTDTMIVGALLRSMVDPDELLQAGSNQSAVADSNEEAQAEDESVKAEEAVEAANAATNPEQVQSRHEETPEQSEVIVVPSQRPNHQSNRTPVVF